MKSTFGFLSVLKTVFVIFSSLLICRLFIANAQEEPASFDAIFGKDTKNPWQIKADNVLFDSKTGQYQAWGKVVISQQDRTLTADNVTFNNNTLKTIAWGNVVFKTGEDELKANRMELDLSQEKGVLYDGEMFLSRNHYYVTGKKIQRIDENTYNIDDATVTSCDGDEPDWRITGKNLNVTLNGYGFVRHGTFWARKLPVLYIPYLFFPVKIDRQSGLLIPKGGYSQRKGAKYDQPFYWAINDYSDATFYDYFMSERGNKIGLEYRYNLDGRSKGTIMFDLLDDLKKDDGLNNSSDDWGYEHDEWLRENSDRYWLRIKQDQSLPMGLSAKLDADLVSDQDFLIEFREGYSGYNAAKKYFTKNFGRTLDSYDDTVRSNSFNVNKTGESYSLNTGVKWYDDVISRRYLDEDKTLQKLPHAELSTLRQKISRTPIYWELGSDYTYFFSKDGTTGHRTDIHPRVYYPYYKKPYFSFEPSFGIRETAWNIEEFEDIPSEKSKNKTNLRHMYDFKLDLKSEVFKIYPVKSGEIGAVKHVISPQIVYDFIPDVSQEEYPWINDLDDDIDFIDQKNRITFAITNFLITKSKISPDKKDGLKYSSKNEEYPYRQIMRFKLAQGYEFNDDFATIPAGLDIVKYNNHFLPLEAELELMPSDFFSILADAKWRYDEKEFLTRNFELMLSNRRGDRLYIDYRFTEDITESIRSDIIVKLTDRLSSYYDYERSLLYDEDVATGIGFVYDKQCWAFDVGFAKEKDDRKVEFLLELKGLGELGTK